MVMEYLDGADLDSELARRGALPPVEAVDYLLQASEAIAEAHAHGLVHRDIKPANLFLTRKADGSPLVKVLDFGIARAAPSDPSFNMTKTRAIMGSPGYMSPEQLRSSRRADARSDIWALGVVLYQLLSGREPFSGETFSHLCITIATEPPAPLAVPGVSPALEAAITRCLEKDPAQRFQNVAELAAALEPFANGSRGAAARISRVLQLSTVPPVSAAPAVPRHAQPTTLSSAASEQRHPVAAGGRGHWIAAGAALAVLAIAAVVVAALAGGDTGPAAAVAPDAALSIDVDAATPATAVLDAAPAPDASAADKRKAEAEVANDRGEGLFRDTRYAEARAEFERAIELDPEPHYILNLCLAHEALEAWDAAIETCEEVIAARPDERLVERARAKRRAAREAKERAAREDRRRQEHRRKKRPKSGLDLDTRQ
jgi:serine/threonine-protein kinase